MITQESRKAGKQEKRDKQKNKKGKAERKNNLEAFPKSEDRRYLQSYKSFFNNKKNNAEIGELNIKNDTWAYQWLRNLKTFRRQYRFSSSLFLFEIVGSGIYPYPICLYD